MRHAFVPFVAATAILSFACGGGNAKSASPTVATPTASQPSATRAAPTATTAVATAAVATPVPAAPTQAPPTLPPPTSEPQPTAAPPPTEAPPPPPSGGSVTLAALNLLFDTKALAAAAGSVTVTFDNRDTGIAHNVHFFSSAGSIGMTDVESGPVVQTLSLGTLERGAYHYKCDVHPTTMTGVLTVS